MTTKEEIASLFNVFHDGVIDGIEVSENSIFLTIYCPYLAEVLDSTFENFYLILNGLKHFSFETWSEDNSVIHCINTIVDLGIEILSAELDELGNIIVATSINNSTGSFNGGNLIIDCENYSVFDHLKGETSLGQLTSLAKEYWSGL